MWRNNAPPTSVVTPLQELRITSTILPGAVDRTCSSQAVPVVAHVDPAASSIVAHPVVAVAPFEGASTRDSNLEVSNPGSPAEVIDGILHEATTIVTEVMTDDIAETKGGLSVKHIIIARPISLLVTIKLRKIPKKRT
jgi:hypothetical protein